MIFFVKLRACEVLDIFASSFIYSICVTAWRTSCDPTTLHIYRGHLMPSSTLNLSELSDWCNFLLITFPRLPIGVSSLTCPTSHPGPSVSAYAVCYTFIYTWHSVPRSSGESIDSLSHPFPQNQDHSISNS